MRIFFVYNWGGSKSINRNILECKFKNLEKNNKDNPVLNRNILECKFTALKGAMSSIIVLIETYWNVNNVMPIRLIWMFPY